MQLIKKDSTEIKAIGLMSGTSLDGLDIAYCSFKWQNNQWQYRLMQAETIPYSSWWKKRLETIFEGSAEDYAKTHVDFGHYCGQEVLLFMEKHAISDVHLIASHGQTVFHNPQQQYTSQIGDLSAINAVTKLPVVGDFRSKDIALGGQGAPLVPIGDRFLFSEYVSCINLGGFANTSYELNGARIAFDICPVNIALNHFCQMLNVPFDKDGNIARQNNIHHDCLSRLNHLNYYHLTPPKSLGREWMEDTFLPILLNEELGPEDAIATCTEHAAYILGKSLKPGKNLITGGGAYNTYLIELIQKYAPLDAKIHLPESNIIEFKEALIFAFLGVLRMLGEPNVLKSVTGAKMDHSSGAIYL